MCPLAGRGSIVLDRVVASIGQVAITLSDVEQEYRLELFLDGKFPRPPEKADLARARERLTYQALLALELENEPTDLGELQKAAARRLDEVRSSFGGRAKYALAWHALGMTESQVLEQLVLQERILRMIDQRFRPATSPTPEEVQAYYQSTFLPEYTKREGGTPPALAQVEDQIREILVQKKIDQLLQDWLEEQKLNRRVIFQPF